MFLFIDQLLSHFLMVFHPKFCSVFSNRFIGISDRYSANKFAPRLSSLTHEQVPFLIEEIVAIIVIKIILFLNQISNDLLKGQRYRTK